MGVCSSGVYGECAEVVVVMCCRSVWGMILLDDGGDDNDALNEDDGSFNDDDGEF